MLLTDKQLDAIADAIEKAKISIEAKNTIDFLLENYLSTPKRKIKKQAPEKTQIALFTRSDDIRAFGDAIAKAVHDLRNAKGKNSFSAMLKRKKISFGIFADKASNIPEFKKRSGMAIIISSDSNDWRKPAGNTEYLEIARDDIAFIRSLAAKTEEVVKSTDIITAAHVENVTEQSGVADAVEPSTDLVIALDVVEPSSNVPAADVPIALELSSDATLHIPEPPMRHWRLNTLGNYLRGSSEPSPSAIEPVKTASPLVYSDQRSEEILGMPTSAPKHADDYFRSGPLVTNKFYLKSAKESKLPQRGRPAEPTVRALISMATLRRAGKLPGSLGLKDHKSIGSEPLTDPETQPRPLMTIAEWRRRQANPDRKPL